ncbi:response regulator [Allopseudospirillum japonicum]|nr:response regulator [Allopseudospirillum japonicum]
MNQNRNFRVLLVEDEAADAHLIKMAFKESRILIDLQHVEDGIEALAYLANEAPYQQAQRPDLILLDLNMPRMDGKAFLQAQKENDHWRMIPTVVLTTSEAESDIMASYNLGAAGYVVKPLDVMDFIKKVQNLEEYWISLVKLPSFY